MTPTPPSIALVDDGAEQGSREMSETVKHTEGPWLVEDYSEGDESKFFVVPHTYFGTVAQCEKLEDARLISAAPDLLAIAERILDRGYVSESIEEERDDHLALVAAIAKAEGRS